MRDGCYYKLSEGNSIVLDLIRGVSSQLVVVGHGISFFGIFKFLHQPNFPWMQNIAVLVFFLLSGFIITYSTMLKKTASNVYSFRYFFIDRFSRIYPPFVASLFFVFLLDFINKNVMFGNYKYLKAFNLETFIVNLLMLQDFPFIIHYTSFGSARPFWTIAVEWWIYLFFGYLVLRSSVEHKNLLVQLLMMFFLSIVPIYNFIGGRGNGLTVYWLLGATVYLVSTKKIFSKVNFKFKVGYLLIFFSLAILRISQTMQEYDPIFACALAGMLLILMDISDNIKFSVVTKKIIKYISSYSYTLYLVHYSILDFLHTNYKDTVNPYFLFLLGFILSNIVGMLLGRYTELNFTVLVKKYFYVVVGRMNSEHTM